MTAGQMLAHYRILERLGAGGMGEVYKALDTHLGREVAIKVLPPEFVRDAERLARFEREARVLASLNHPNIAAIYGFEQADGAPFLVLEYVPGPTLAETVAAGAIEVREALRIGGQIAEALEAAHDKAFVHRDLKPANIKVTPEGKVKLLDFGLAKAFADEPPSADPRHSPTMSMLATRAGMILGTAAYMSPEQARGKPLDKRTDIWSFGCVLYEALAGRAAFGGETISHIIVAVMEREPDWAALPAGVTGKVRELLRRCLAKDASRRLRDIGDARFELEEAQPLHPEPTAAPAESRAEARRGPKPALLAWSGAAVLMLALAVLAFVHFRETPPAAETVRFEIPPPGKSSFGNSFSVSPDGRKIAFTASGPDGRMMIWVRTLGSLEARALPGTDNAFSLFWSPDSRFIGFGDQGARLRKVEAAGGPPQTLCAPGGAILGGAWNREGVIIFGTLRGPVFRVPASGGVPTPVITPDASQQGGFPRPASFLPDGRHFVYLASARGGQRENNAVYLASLDEKPDAKRKRLVSTEFAPAYAPSADGRMGHLLFLRENTLMAQAFDEDRLELTGEPFPVAEQVGTFRSAGFFSASANGLLVYRTGGGARRRLTWFDRDGKPLEPLGEPGDYNDLNVSPDETRVAVTRRDSQGSTDIWLLERARGAASRFTFEAAVDWRAVWSPDGSRIAFTSGNNLFVKDSSGAGSNEKLIESGNEKYTSDWSSDGRFLIYTDMDAKTGADIWALPLSGDRKPTPFLRTQFTESQGQLSPDGRWLAYISNESGRFEVYVQPFPAAAGGGGKWMVSSAGGYQPRWRKDGKELFYIDGERKLTAVPVSTAPRFASGAPKPLFETRIAGGSQTQSVHRYAVAANGTRFLINTAAEDTTGAPITVVMNWNRP